MFKNIFVPTDGSEFSQATQRAAVSVAKAGGARITAFHAKQSYPDARFGQSGLIAPISAEQFDDYERRETEHILAFAERLCAESGVICETMSAVSDDPAAAIIAASTQCGADLIFMATHGWNKMGHLFVGSETRKVLLLSKIPVLIFR